MDLNTVIEKLIQLQKQGLGDCEVVFKNESVNYHEFDIEELKLEYKKNWEKEDIDEDEEITIQQYETLICICGTDEWEPKTKPTKNSKNSTVNIGIEFKLLKQCVINFLKGVGLGNVSQYPRGFTPRELRDIFPCTEIEMRKALSELRTDNLIGSTGSCRGLKFVAIEFIHEAEENYKKEYNERRSLR